MNPPNPKTWALAIALFLAAWAICFLTGCEQKEPGHTINAGPTADDVAEFAKRQNFVTKADHERQIENLKRDHVDALTKEFKRGAKEQAVSQAQMKPIYITEFRDKELLVYEIIERYKDTLPTEESKSAANPPTELKAQKAKVE